MVLANELVTEQAGTAAARGDPASLVRHGQMVLLGRDGGCKKWAQGQPPAVASSRWHISHLPPHSALFPPGRPLQETGCTVCLENPEPLLVSARLRLCLLWGLRTPTRSFSELSEPCLTLWGGWHHKSATVIPSLRCVSWSGADNRQDSDELTLWRAP